MTGFAAFVTAMRFVAWVADAANLFGPNRMISHAHPMNRGDRRRLISERTRWSFTKGGNNRVCLLLRVR